MKQRLGEAVEDYLAHRKSEGLAKNTLKNDRTALVKLVTEVGSIYVENVTARHITDLFSTLGAKRSPRSLAQSDASLRSFFKWCVQTRRTTIPRNPMEGRKAPRWHKTERRRVPMHQFPHLLDSARTPRDRAVVALNLYTLARISEITDMRIDDLDLQGGYLRARVFKGRLDDDLPICTELDAELRRWLTIYAKEAGELQGDWRLVPAYTAPPPRVFVPGERARPDRAAQRPKPLSPLNNPEHIIKRSLEAIGFPLRDTDGKSTREGTHTLRRSGARALYEAWRESGHDFARDDIQALLHHKSSAQTDDYIGMDSKRASRDQKLRGKVMFPGLVADNVTELKVVREQDG